MKLLIRYIIVITVHLNPIVMGRYSIFIFLYFILMITIYHDNNAAYVRGSPRVLSLLL